MHPSADIDFLFGLSALSFFREWNGSRIVSIDRRPVRRSAGNSADVPVERRGSTADAARPPNNRLRVDLSQIFVVHFQHFKSINDFSLKNLQLQF